MSYYDFRNNDARPGLPTDYWLVHADSAFSSPASWATGEKRLTDTSFNMENAAPTSRGYFLGDYQGLAAAGNNFYALFGQAGNGASDPSNIWFRDPPPQADLAMHDPTATEPPTALATTAGDNVGPLGDSEAWSFAFEMRISGSNPTDPIATPELVHFAPVLREWRRGRWIRRTVENDLPAAEVVRLRSWRDAPKSHDFGYG